MSLEREQDKWLSRLLRLHSAGSPASQSVELCLDAETLAAWADRSLNAREIAAAELHAARCARCTALIAAFARTAPPVPVAARSKNTLFRWLVPLTAAATAVAIWVVVPERRTTPGASEESAPAVAMAPPQPQPSAPSPESSTRAVPAAPVEVPEAMQKRPQSRSARTDALSDSARNPEPDVRQEVATPTDTFAAARERAAAPAASPAPPASVDASKDTPAALARRGLSEAVTVTIEDGAPNDPQIRWRSASGSDVERSMDAGKTWTKTASSPPGPIVAIRAVDALNATVTTSNGQTFSTTDGGANWVPVQEKSAAPF